MVERNLLDPEAWGHSLGAVGELGVFVLRQNGDKSQASLLYDLFQPNTRQMFTPWKI